MENFISPSAFDSTKTAKFIPARLSACMVLPRQECMTMINFVHGTTGKFGSRNLSFCVGIRSNITLGGLVHKTSTLF